MKLTLLLIYFAFVGLNMLRILYFNSTYAVGRDSSVGTATRYVLGVPGIESRRGRYFSHPSIPAVEITPSSYKVGNGSLLGVKRPRRGLDYPPPTSAEVTERVDLYFYSPVGPS